ncbi:hypothetical protein SAMN05421594_4625 [Chryseobacterium oleae]|uniref:Uncharacterized protein n=1 Tax=Chryseobacterium oleae TaxID=491207 RepID=A0A1I5CRM0_CHROL|nr:hypothetical protein [Chryseobacterium oleae]SFN89583.1 hypothetical protein SAMN05421594_4625 [Chryseobacterium oleae]
MNRKNLFVAATILSNVAYSQVGINTPSPISTFDITAKNTTGASTSVDGLLIPRVDRQRAQSMAAVPISTLVYINSVTTGTQTGTAINMDTVGYYYYNGTAWAKLNAPINNIYNTDGTLTANRTVNQADKTLAFTGTAVNAFSVDGNTVSVDAANNRVGIGTLTPQKTLHVNGSAQVTNELNVGGNATTAGSAGTTGQILSSNGANAAPSWVDKVTASTGVGVTKQHLTPANPNSILNSASGDYSFRYSSTSTNGYWQIRLNTPSATVFSIFDVEFESRLGSVSNDYNNTVYQRRLVTTISPNVWTSLNPNNAAGAANEYNVYHIYNLSTGVIVRFTCALSALPATNQSMILEEF